MSDPRDNPQRAAAAPDARVKPDNVSAPAVHPGEAVELFDAAFDQAVVGMVLADLRGRVIRVNDAFCRLVGYAAEELLGRDSRDYTHPDDRGPNAIKVRQVGGSATDRAVYEKRYFHKNGSLVWAEITLSPVRGRHGGPISAMIALVTDVTSRRRAEARDQFLARMEEAVRPLEDADAIVAACARLLGEHLGADRCAYAYFEPDGETYNIAGDFCRPGIPSLVGRHALDHADSEFNRLTRAGEPYVVHDVATHRPPLPSVAGYAQIKIAALVAVTLLEAGKPAVGMSVHQAVPRHWEPDEVELVRQMVGRCWESVDRARSAQTLRRAEERVAQQARLFDATASSTPDFIYVFDLDARFAYANAQLLKIWGVTFEQAVGKGLRELGYPEWHAAMHEREIEQVIETRRPIRGEVPFTGGSGTFGVYEYIFSPVMSADGQVEAVAGTTRDVTDRKRSEADMQRLAEQRRLALDSAQMGWWHIDAASGDVIWDERFREIYGIRGGRLEYDRLLASIHPDDRERVDADVRASARIEDPRPLETEYRVIRPDGVERWVQAKGRAYYDGEGADRRFTSLVGTVTDVTEQRRAADALRANEQRFRFLSELGEATRDLTDPEQIMSAAARLLGQHLRASRCAYADVDPDGERFHIRHDYTDAGIPSTVGTYALSLFGPRAFADQRAGRTLVLHDVDRELAPAEGGDTFRSIGIAAIICCPLVKRGRLAAMMAVHNAAPRRWSDAEVALVEDVVERSWAYIERARVTRNLRETNDRLRLAQQAGRIGSFEWIVPEGRVIWSPELERLYGVPEGTFEGTFDAWRRRVVPKDAKTVEAGLSACIASKASDYDYEFRAVLPDGAHLWLAGKALFTYDADGKPMNMIGVNVDVDARRRAAEVREQLLEAERGARAEAERQGRAKDEFLATLSHELRTPLNAILGWSQILSAGARDEADLSEGLRTIERNARAQTQIIEDLLDMSRIISGKIRLDVQRVDLASVVRASIETIRPAAEAKGVRIQPVLDPLARPVSGDPGRLQQVFWNLLSNAVKFTPRGGRVQVVLERVNSHLEVSVSDSGEGIKADFMPFVFDRFRQADATSTRLHGGLGLGLSIVKQLIELHGGSVRARSDGPGQGATFTIHLPLTILHVDAESPAAVDARRHPRSGLPDASTATPCADLRGLRVLVIDDEADARALVRRLLEDCHALVQTAGSAQQAVEMHAAEPADVLVSDIGMPGEDGHALIRRIRGLGPDRGGRVPAVALTAYARSEDRTRAILAGFQMHLAKPVEPAELIAAVASLAGRTQAAGYVDVRQMP